MTLDLRRVSASEALIVLGRLRHLRTAPSALPIGEPVVDGGSGGSADDLWLELEALTAACRRPGCLGFPGVPDDGVRAWALMALGVAIVEPRTRFEKPMALTVWRAGEQVPVGLNPRQAAKRLGVGLEEFRALIDDTHAVVSHNLKHVAEGAALEVA